MTFACFALHTVGINVDTRAQVRLTSTAQAHESENLDGKRIVVVFCIPWTRHLKCSI